MLPSSGRSASRRRLKQPAGAESASSPPVPRAPKRRRRKNRPGVANVSPNTWPARNCGAVQRIPDCAEEGRAGVRRSTPPGCAAPSRPERRAAESETAPRSAVSGPRRRPPPRCRTQRATALPAVRIGQGEEPPGECEQQRELDFVAARRLRVKQRRDVEREHGQHKQRHAPAAGQPQRDGIESSSTAIPARNAGSRSVITPAPNTLIESLASSECSRWLFGTARSVKMTESGAET